MRCPLCKKMQNRVIDSRISKNGDMIRRRRECEVCGRRFTTYEKVEYILPMVIKKDGRREEFLGEKIRAGLKKAFEKRQFGSDTIDEIVGDIERKFQELGIREVSTRDIGEEVMSRLQKIDEVAYVRFASVYRQFRDINEFMSELKDMLSEKEKAVRKPGAEKKQRAAQHSEGKGGAKA
jgi:transcriptional repressor NrdR